MVDKYSLKCLNEWVSWILALNRLANWKGKKEKYGGGHEKPSIVKQYSWAVEDQSNPVWLQWVQKLWMKMALKGWGGKSWRLPYLIKLFIPWVGSHSTGFGRWMPRSSTYFRPLSKVAFWQWTLGYRFLVSRQVCHSHMSGLFSMWNHSACE